MADPQPVSALNASDRVLQCFWDLASVEEEQRLKAAQQLAQDVLADQQQNKPSHTPASNAQVPTAKQLEHALRKCSPVMTYALRRLARGVGSGRAASRQGYATALSVVLAAGRSATGVQEPLLALEDGMILLDSCIDNQGGGKGGDAKDALLGKLFGLSALIRAGLVTDAAAASTLISSVLAVGTKKSFLREAAVSVVLELLLGGPASSNPASSPAAENCNAAAGAEQDKKAGKSKKRKADEQLQAPTEPDAVAKTSTSAGARWVSDAVVRQLVSPGPAGCDALRKFLTCSPQEASPEALLLALCLWPYLPEALVAISPLPKNCPAPPASFVTNPSSVPHSQVAPAAAALLSTGYLKQVLPALQSTTASSPRLHQLWSHLLPYLLPGFTPQQQHRSKVPEVLLSQPAQQLNTAHLASFWNTVVEEGLFESSHERKYLGFQLFLVMLPRLPASAADTVFSKNFSRTLTIAISKQESLLHAMAKKVLERVKQFLAKSPDAGAKLRVAAALQRLGQQGAATKATAGLMEGMDVKGVQAYCQQYMDAFVNANADSNTDKEANGHGGSKDMSEDESEETPEDQTSARSAVVEKLRATAADQLVAALKFPAMTDTTRSEVLQFLAACAFFQPAVDSSSNTAAASSAKKKGKKSEAAPALPSHIARLQAAAQAGAAPLSEATRSLCAQRLIAAVMHAPSPVTASKDAAEEGAQQPPTKKQKGNNGQQQQSQADASRLLAPLCHYIKELHSSKSVALAAGELPETVDIALQILRELEGALEPLASQAATSHNRSTRQSRARALLQLVQLLQLYVFGDPANMLDTALFIDLRRAAKDAVELEIEDMEEQEVSDEDEEMSDAKSDDAQADGKENGAVAADTNRPSWSEVLLDVLLSLLSRPSAPLPSASLRLVCEAVWRATCEGLTAAGVQDLLRIVVAGDKSGSADDEEGGVLDDDQEDEDEEEVEMEVGSDSDDESVQEGNGAADSSEDEEDDKNTKAAGADKAQQKQSQKQDVDSSGEESDGDGADDAEMFKMDPKIAAYMRAVADKRRSAREAAAALSALKFRALSLLEVFARKAPSSPLLLLTLLPLIRALSRAARAGPGGNAVLSQRLTTLITKCICKAKPVYSQDVLPAQQPDSSTEGQQPAAGSSSDRQASLEQLLNRLLYLAARADTKPVAEAAGAALALVFKSTAVQGLSKDAQSVAEHAYTATVKDYLRKKKTRLSRSVMEGCCSRAPHLALAQAPLAALLKEAGGGARNGFKQTEATQLLLASVKAASSTLPQEDVFKLLKPHAGALGTVIESAAAGVGMKPAHHAEALKACTAVVEVVKKVLPAGRKLAEMVGPEHLRGTAKAVVTVREVGTSEKVNGQLSRLAQVLGATELLNSTPVDPALRTRIQKAAAAAAAQKQEPKQPAEADAGKGRKLQKGSAEEKTAKEKTTKDKKDKKDKKAMPKKEKKERD